MDKQKHTGIRKWKVNLVLTPSEQESMVCCEKPAGFVTNIFAERDEISSLVSAETEIAAAQRQAMAIAYSPGKSLLSTAFMLWMSGSSIQIFSIMMTGMALINPIKALFSINTSFAKFKKEGVDLTIPRLIFMALQGLSIGVALYKCFTMGLLPVTSADWVNLLPQKTFLESAGMPVL